MFGFNSKKLPDCNTLFKKYLSPWYHPDERPVMTRPDLYEIAGFNDVPINFKTLQYLPPDLLSDSMESIKVMTKAALEDFQEFQTSDTFDLNFLDTADKYFDRQRIKDIIKISNPKDYDNLYLVTVCELGCMLGQLFRQTGEYDWLYSTPYFHSIIVHRHTGIAITVFDWSVKKLSEYGVEDGLVSKFQAAINNIRE